MAREWVGACALMRGCVLQVGHAGECKLGDVAEEEYEVERIVDQRAKRGGRREYLIKWLGFQSHATRVAETSPEVLHPISQ